MNTNSENPKVGKAFQEMVCKSVEEYFQTDFDLEVAIPIGNIDLTMFRMIKG